MNYSTSFFSWLDYYSVGPAKKEELDSEESHCYCLGYHKVVLLDEEAPEGPLSGIKEAHRKSTPTQLRRASAFNHTRYVAKRNQIVHHRGTNAQDATQLCIEHVKVEKLANNDYSEKLDYQPLLRFHSQVNR